METGKNLVLWFDGSRPIARFWKLPRAIEVTRVLLQLVREESETLYL